MGFSTIETDTKTALFLASTKEVTEASDTSYFYCKYWQNRIKKAEIGDNGKIYFILTNNDFVVCD